MRRTLCVLLVVLAGCARPQPETRRLPTGVALDPAGVAVRLGSMPLTMRFSPDSARIVTVLCGYREQGIQVIDRAARRVVQTIVQPAAFVGACFSPDGTRLFVSGGNRDVVYEYAWRADSAALADSIVLGPPPGPAGGRRYPAGLGCSPDGSHLYAAENLGDTLAVVDLRTRHIVQQLATGRYPYDVVVHRDGRVYVSAWGSSWVAVFKPGAKGLVGAGRISVGPHPTTLLMDDLRDRIYATCATSDRIAMIDTQRDSLTGAFSDSAPGGPAEGSTPNGLALSPHGQRLYVAEADNDAVAVFDLDATPGGAQLLGRIPVEWYPDAVLTRGDSLWVLNGKGSGTGPNPGYKQPGFWGERDKTQYTLGQTNGSLSFLARPKIGDLREFSQRVAVSNHWDRAPVPTALPPFQHVIYVVRENRTFDQVLGDLSMGDCDSSLTFFPRAVTPNAHALAERFGVFDRFFVNGEVSGDGHNWSMAAYASDYVEKTIPSNYSKRGRAYDYDGLNRDRTTDEDVNEPSTGYLWDLAHRARVSLRNYGEFTRRTADGRWAANKPWLAACTDTSYPGWDLGVPDSVRAERWIAAFRKEAAGDSMPALSILWLPNDHTAGALAGSPTPRAYVADNDLALGRIVEALSHSRYWKSTVMFVLEDDAQNGPDHFDSHRSPLLVISPYGRRGVVHRFANTTDVIATIDQVLHLGALSKYDHFGRPLGEAFVTSPDTSAYVALAPSVSRHEVNPDSTEAARLSRRLDLSEEDRADVALFNRILWQVLKGPDRPYPKRSPQPRS